MPTIKPLKGKKLEAAISECYNRHFNCIQVDMMDLGKIYRAASDAYALYQSIGAMDTALAPLVAVYRKN